MNENMSFKIHDFFCNLFVLQSWSTYWFSAFVNGAFVNCMSNGFPKDFSVVYKKCTCLLTMTGECKNLKMKSEFLLHIVSCAEMEYTCQACSFELLRLSVPDILKKHNFFPLMHCFFIILQCILFSVWHLITKKTFVIFKWF